MFQTANGFLPGGSITTTIQNTYTIHISHITYAQKIPLKTKIKTEKQQLTKLHKE
jgi:hypothetical protein